MFIKFWATGEGVRTETVLRWIVWEKGKRVGTEALAL